MRQKHAKLSSDSKIERGPIPLPLIILLNVTQTVKFNSNTLEIKFIQLNTKF